MAKSRSAKQILSDLAVDEKFDLAALSSSRSIQLKFNQVFGEEINIAEIAMSDETKDLEGEEILIAEGQEDADDEDAATLVINLDDLKQELGEAGDGQEIEAVDLDFGGADNDSSDLVEEIVVAEEIGEDDAHDMALEQAIADDEAPKEFIAGSSSDMTESDFDLQIDESSSLEEAADLGDSDGGLGEIDLSLDDNAVEGTLELSGTSEDMSEVEEVISDDGGLGEIGLSLDDSSEEIVEKIDGGVLGGDLDFAALGEDESEGVVVEEASDDLQLADVEMSEGLEISEDLEAAVISSDLLDDDEEVALEPSAEDLEYPDMNASEDMTTGGTEIPGVIEEAVPDKASIDDHNQYVKHHDEELLKLQATIKNVRDDRETLMAQIAQLEEEKMQLKQEKISFSADLDETKIELSLLKKRHSDLSERSKYEVALYKDKNEVATERVKKYKQEFERLNQKVRLDFNKIQAREKELENQLELLRSDTDVQLQNRDDKILQLKRKIDTLEFDIENIGIQESRNIESNFLLEDKIEKAMTTLRLAIEVLEDEDGLGNLDTNALKQIKNKKIEV